MCLIIRSDKLIAKHDITVYKYGKVYFRKNIFTPSVYDEFEYKPNTITGKISIYPVQCVHVASGRKLTYQVVESGYHSYYTDTYSILSKLISEIPWTGFQRFVIPEGATYYLGMKSDAVSSQIIWKPRLMTRILLKIFK